jgi:hypothetical protein
MIFFTSKICFEQFSKILCYVITTDTIKRLQTVFWIRIWLDRYQFDGSGSITTKC